MIAVQEGTMNPRQILTRRKDCRGCLSTRLIPILTLGEVPLANSFLKKPDQAELRFPLELYFCEQCSLVQLLHVVNPGLLFSDYIYRTGTNATIAHHNQELATTVSDTLQLGGGDLVVEVASNDGSLLQCFRSFGVRTLGIEPAGNIAAIAQAAGVATVQAFFDADCACRVLQQHGPASLIVANNVLAHVDQTIQFLAAMKALLKRKGRILIEVPYLQEMLDGLEYDTIYHEHLSYFSVNALLPLFSQAGLSVERIDRVDIHGGSLRIWAKHWGEGGHSAAVLEEADAEARRGLNDLQTYRQFAHRVEANREQLRSLLADLQEKGKTLAGYGAPAKGNTLLCYCGIDSAMIPYTVDRSPLKVGMYTPGSRIPVQPFETILAQQPDFVLILAWNFATEITESLQTYSARGGRFILPIPEPKIL